MRRYLTTLSLAVLALAAGAASVYALAIAMPPPGPQRMGNADALIVGRVVGVEPQDVEVEPFPGNTGKQKYRIAVVKVNEVIRGAKDMKQIRVAFYPPPENNVDPGGGIRIRPGFRGRNITLEVGQDGLFILNKHHKENFYLPPQFGNFVSSEQEDNFKKEVEFAKKAAKILDNPMASLKSKDADERMQALSIVINKYRNPGPAVGYKTDAASPPRKAKSSSRRCWKARGWLSPSVSANLTPGTCSTSSASTGTRRAAGNNRKTCKTSASSTTQPRRGSKTTPKRTAFSA